MEEEYQTIIYAGKETRNREYKQSFPWNRTTHGSEMAKVTKTILAMSNLRDGGHIVIGVNETSNPTQPYIAEGLAGGNLVTFNYEVIADFVRNYAEPYVAFNVDIVENSTTDASFVIIAVNGFQDYPVICKKSYADILHEGTVYVRPRGGRPQSGPILHYSDMRELLDIAVEKGVKRFLEIQARVGSLTNEDSELFEKQLDDFS